MLFEKLTILDGAMGTELVAMKAPMGKIPEELNITHPEMVKKVHQSYIDAGTEMIYTCTFGANAYKCKHSQYSVTELVTAAVKNALEVAKPAGARTALSMGTIGDILEPFGNLKFNDAYEMYKEMAVAAEAAGVDCAVLETQTDLLEVKAGVLAIKENTKLPIMVTMTFEPNGRTFSGTLIESMGIMLEALGVDAVGVNCSLGPKELYPMVERLMKVTGLPIVVKPNAGLPDPMTGAYAMSPDEFADEMMEYVKLGVAAIGGCCGTSPLYIKALCERLCDCKAGVASCADGGKKFCRKVDNSFLCSARDYVDVKTVHVVGERINPTGKKLFKEALLNHDIDYVKNQAIEQTEAGAEILDVNVGLPGIDEVSMMKEVVTELQALVSAPLQIDSSNAEAIEAALRVYAGKALVNSVNGEPEVLDRILPIAKKYGAAIIGLTMDSRGIPTSCAERVEIAERIVNKCKEYGIETKDIYLDCLTLTVSAQQKDCVDTLQAIREVKKKFGVHCVLGVSNISFGLPKREYINTTFLTLAMEAGLNLPIINPNNSAMMGAVDSFLVLTNVDDHCTKYVAKYAEIQAREKEESEKNKAILAAALSENSAKRAAEGTTAVSAAGGAVEGAKAGSAAGGAAEGAKAVSAAGGDNRISTNSISYFVKKGLAESTAKAVDALLLTTDALDIVNNELIPALDIVGSEFERGVLFLPQLLASAKAAEAGFDVIKKSMESANKGSISKGKVVIATVKGDVHDIGKNIVKTILENYGFTVIDLGKDVDPAAVVEAAKREDVRLVGLSALMTTTVVGMEETIRAIREAGLNTKIVVGGAVLTEDYAKKIGADFYAKDAKQTADIAKSVYGA